MTTARALLVDASVTRWYHCVVRRADREEDVLDERS